MFLFLILNIQTQNHIFLIGFIIALLTSVIIGFKIFINYRSFKRKAFFRDEQIEPLKIKINDTDLAIKICLEYRNGSSFQKIADMYGFKEKQQVKRKLVQGLDILLKKYRDKK